MNGDDYEEIERLKKKLAKEFEIKKNIEKLKYFLGIEVAQSKKGIFIYQKKYILDLLKERDMVGCEPTNEQNHKLREAREDAVVECGMY